MTLLTTWNTNRKSVQLALGLASLVTLLAYTFWHTGGVVYAAKGMFMSRGTDTIPAMLTPGEMVLTKRQQSALFSSLQNGPTSGSSGRSTDERLDRLIDLLSSQQMVVQLDGRPVGKALRDLKRSGVDF